MYVDQQVNEYCPIRICIADMMCDGIIEEDVTGERNKACIMVVTIPTIIKLLSISFTAQQIDTYKLT